MKSVYRKYLTKVALAWMSCFVLFFFAYMLMLAPQKNSKEQLNRLLEEKKQMYSSALRATQKETQVQLNEQIEQLRDKLKDFVVDFEDSTDVTFDISQIANAKEVTSFSIETNKRDNRTPTESDKYIFESRIEVNFLTTDFNQFAALLNALERHRPVIFVDSFAITRSYKDSADRQVKMSLVVFVRRTQDS
ncbi:MAG: GspMb/PilO family protein [Phycisphaerae bacterium]|nr:GspMb/PilO family protein [Phycisphaerae bacterium]MDD5380348.1 GspMb/PilO family protein [Phycisphaerae bacterium]